MYYLKETIEIMMIFSPICLSTQKLIYCKKAYQNIASSVQPLC